MNDKYILTVEEDVVDGKTDYFITFPDELLESMGVSPGDYIQWTDNNDGSFSITKTNA